MKSLSPKEMTKNKSYHIYLEDKCLFKNLDQSEFDLIWDKIYRSYFRDELTYSEVEDADNGTEHSY